MTTERQLTRDELLDRARAAYDSKAWATAVELLMAADREAPLDLDGLELLGESAHLVGRDDVAVQAGMRGFAVGAESGEFERAARAGWWTAMGFMYRGEIAQGGAWFGRVADLIEKLGRESVESGYLLIPVALGQEEGHDPEAAFQTYEQISAIAERFGDVDLATFGRLGRGEALIAMGERDRGIRLLDEAMAGVTAGEVSPSVAGMVYCATIEDCYAIFDIRRAQEWTTALTDWCASQPDIVFRGHCLIFRAELMRFHGDWTTAADEVQRARLVLSGPPVHPAIGDAHYETAEQHRVRGSFEEAERAYAEASAFGHRGEPGLALLRLAQGRAAPARNMIARALEEEPTDPRLLEAAVTIALGRGDVPEARSFVDRLRPSAGSASRRCSRRSPLAPRARSCSPKANRARRFGRCAPRSECGSSSMRPMTRRVSALESPVLAAHSVTARPPSSRPPPREACSRHSVRRRRLQSWTAAAPATVSVRASSRCCTSSPAGEPIARSPTSSGSVSGPWTGT